MGSDKSKYITKPGAGSLGEGSVEAYIFIHMFVDPSNHGNVWR